MIKKKIFIVFLGVLFMLAILTNFANAQYEREFSGYGKKKIRNINMQEGLAIIEIKYPKPYSIEVNFYEVGGENGRTVLERGPIKNRYFLNIPKDATYYLNVKSRGPWRVKISHVTPHEGKELPIKFSGKGSQLSPFLYLEKGPVTFRITKLRRGKYRVMTVLTNERGIPVVAQTGILRYGDPPGTVTKNTEIRYPGIYLLQIESEGKWIVEIY